MTQDKTPSIKTAAEKARERLSVLVETEAGRGMTPDEAEEAKRIDSYLAGHAEAVLEIAKWIEEEHPYTADSHPKFWTTREIAAAIREKFGE